MKRIGFFVACGALALAAGCDNRPSGDRDSGGITLMDSGPDMDDAGTPRPDTGTPPTGCSTSLATGWGPLPASCLPRCAASTITCIQGCAMGDAACQQTCISNDTAPPVAFTIDGMAAPDGLDCEFCINWQGNSCVFDSCPDQFAACINCDGCNPNDPSVPGCEAEEAALNSCATDADAAINTCFQGRAGGCFPG